MSSELPEQTQGDRGSRPALDAVLGTRGRLARIESLSREAAALALREARRADEIRKNFAATVAALEAQLQEKEGELRQRESGLGEQGKSLEARIGDLENQLREKEELLQIRNADLHDLKSKLEEATTSAAAEAERAQEIQGRFEATVAALKAELGEKEVLLKQNDIACKDMEESLARLEESLVNQIRVLESQLEEMVQKNTSETSPETGKTKSPRKSGSKAEES
ncbi:MAG: hypothetical protein HYY45_15610 [Deltaproteobacteria bacterium]|nr:hypothetical protein [Deltaproteobacteria bacterium]